MKRNKTIWLFLFLFIFAISSASVAKKKKAEPIDCGTDLDCFIEASKQCAPATVHHTATFNLFGMLQTTTTFLEIQAEKKGKCTVYMKTEKNDITFSDELIQKMLSDGATKEQVRQKEHEANQYADMAEGLDALCTFRPDDLITMVQRWKAGGFSTRDYEAGECEGSMFGGQPKADKLPAPQQISPVNGAVFSHYPRKTTLKWDAVPGAKSYTVEIDCFHCCTSNTWCTDVGRTWKVTRDIKRTNYMFNFVGAQPGRWRVWAVGKDGQESPKTEWWEFQYTR